MTENHIVTPTYQSILMNALNTVINRRNENDIIGTWNALGTLYDWLPGECYTEITPIYQKIVKELQGILDANNQIDWYIRNTQRQISQEKKLQIANRILSTEISKSMRAHSWLDRDASIKPRNKEVPTI
jgi:hypothetical protein